MPTAPADKTPNNEDGQGKNGGQNELEGKKGLRSSPSGAPGGSPPDDDYSDDGGRQRKSVLVMRRAYTIHQAQPASEATIIITGRTAAWEIMA